MIEWNRDPAASGWRSRAFLSAGEVGVYDTGDWYVRLKSSAMADATGRASSITRGKRSALAVYTALTGSDA